MTDRDHTRPPPVTDGGIDYRKIFENANVGIAINDPATGEIGEVNRKYAEMLGYDVDELAGMSIEAVSADDPSFDQAAAMDRIEQVLDGEPQTFDWLLERRDGGTTWVEISLKRTTVGDDVRIVAFLRDVTERKERKRDLEFVEEMVETLGVGVAAYREDGEFEYVNEGFANILEVDRERLEDLSVLDVNPELDPERFPDYWASLDVGETRTTETIHALDGHEVVVETVTTCTEIEGTRYHFGTIQDITERKRQEERFQAFVEQSNDIITVLDGAGDYKYQSPSAQRVLGYEQGELMGENAFEYLHPDDQEYVMEKFGAALETPDEALVVEYRFRHADGSWRWLESRGFNQLDNPYVEGFVVNSRDVTDRKRHERQIAALHDVTRRMVQASDAGAVCDVAVETVESVLGHSIAGMWLADESSERLEPVAQTPAAEDLFGDHPVYTAGNSLSWEAFEGGETMHLEDLQAASDRHNPATPLESELVVPLGEYGVMNVGATEPGAFSDNDVALLKLLGANAQAALGRNERERLLERQTDRMEFFNSILRHDVLNAVTVIKSRAEFLTEELEGEQLRDAETIVDWSDDVKDIVQRVRTVLETLTGEGDPQLETVDPAVELRSEIDRLRPTYPEVTFEIGVPDDVTVVANDLLGDAFGNILTNAVDHNDTDGLVVSTTVERGEEWVVVRIADNGSGVADDRKEAIFRRGETGHAKSVGSGFGLFFVDAMVEEYGGEVTVEDNADGGATFVIRLPAVEASTA